MIAHQTKPPGNGRALCCADDFVGDETFAMLWGDGIAHAGEPALAQLLRVCERTGAAVLRGRRVPLHQVDRYGIVAGDSVDEQTLNVRSIVEKSPLGTATSDLAQVKGCVFTNRLMQ